VTTPWVREDRFDIDGHRWAVRQAGDPAGRPVVYCHGTPSCRLEPAYADAACSRRAIRLVSFDRPGYGESAPQPFGLASVATATGALADRLGLDRFATLGQSGGGPFSLAAGAVLGDRVTRVGVTAGAVPFQLVPGALDLLDEDDKAAVARLLDREAAAAGFAKGFEPLLGMAEAPVSAVEAGLRGRSIPHDQAVLDRSGGAVRAVVAALQAALRQGTGGGAWDNVAWVGPWDIDLDAVRRPVHLWYGGAIEHLDEVLETLID
jgi:pimeloyl-ACP methyl ester carboxylesterase